ncbi:MAG: T9SS type A sorting domain-containing protein [Bacteroidetes bacterium]|nr:T9SS type A sorting domain-containing protein [Bacteroidota bacterium]
MTLPYRLVLLFSLSLFTQSLSAQREERLGGLDRMPRNEDALALSPSTAKSKQALNLPFKDDFSYPGNTVDPSKWELSDVWVNQTWARSPITLGIATFDGLNRFGRPFRYVGNDSVGDVLSSREIDLSNVSDSVYLSFYFQAGGWGEPPSGGVDSLVLEFWRGSDSSWRSIWRSESYPESDWEQVMQAVESDFHRSDFRFRFRNFGSKAGALDIWHIDYVRLDDQRTYLDTALNDIAYTRPHPSLMINYESIPWWHVNESFNIENRFKPDLRLHYRRNSDPSGPSPNLTLGEFNITFNGSIIAQNGAPDSDLDNSHGDNIEVRFPVPDTADAGRPRLNYINPPYADEFELISRHTYSGSPQLRSANDTITRHQVFKNYYAYDDGSAERSYEILNNKGGFIAQRYDVLVNDTLKGLQIYFQPAIHNIEDQEFTILVLSNQSGLPSSIIYESDSVYTAQYTDGNFYQSYLLDTTLIGPSTSGTVFIGIRQLNAEPLSLGYDQNSRNRSTAFYGELDDMYQSFLEGTIMIRPLFRYIPRDFSLTDGLASKPFEVFPNPSEGLLNFNLPLSIMDLSDYQLRLYNLQGQLIESQAPSEKWQLRALPAGLYIVRLESPTNRQQWQSKIQIR